VFSFKGHTERYTVYAGTWKARLVLTHYICIYLLLFQCVMPMTNIISCFACNFCVDWTWV